MSNSSHATTGAATPPPAFTPVPVRPRHDGWTPGRQVAFLHALAECGNVDAACRQVGMSQQSAYALRSRPDAVSFRQAWLIALDHGIGRLADNAMTRAMEGVVVPVFYKGEQVGERRVFNERLTMFLLRAHDPMRYGAWRERLPVSREAPDGQAELFRRAVQAAAQDAVADEAGRPRPKRKPLLSMIVNDDADDADNAQSQALRSQAAYYERRFAELESENERLHAANGSSAADPADPDLADPDFAAPNFSGDGD